MDLELARSKVQGPAIGLIVIAILSVLQTLLNVVYSLAMGAEGYAQSMINAGVPPEMVGMLSNIGVGCGGCLGLILNGVTLFAGLKMRNLQSYGLCIAGSVLALLPCGGFCCCLGLAVGIWSLVTLSREDVKAAFQAASSGV